MTSTQEDTLIIAGKKFRSRLFVGTGKFASPAVLRQVVEASGTALVTVAIRRVSTGDSQDPATAGIPDDGSVLLLPNTSGARDAHEAVRVARLGRALAGHEWVKLEVTPDPASLLPDPVETLKAAEMLVKEGFVVLPYINADPILAKRLEEIGTATVMPLAAPIGTNRGLTTKEQLQMIIDTVRIPVVVDAGIGLPSHAAAAMEMGADAVLVNTALATAGDPPSMASAFAMAVKAGRQACLAGPGRVSDPEPSSPLTGFLR